MTDARIVERAADRAEDRRGHRLMWLFVGLALFGLAVLTTAFFSYRAASTDEIRALDRRADDNATVANRLADQVEQLGATPVVDPPSPVDDADPDDPEAQDPEVQDPEIQNPETQDPEIQDPEKDDAAIPGPAGRDGQTPPCMSEPTQCRGTDGANGKDGEEGPQGPPGPTCPNGYTAASRTYDPTPLVAGDEETWWVCVADGGQG